MSAETAAPSSPRVYTVKELEALREVVETKWLFGSYYAGFSRTSRPYKVKEKLRAVEALVRAHMLVGLVAADLLATEPRPAPFTWADEMMLELRRETRT